MWPVPWFQITLRCGVKDGAPAAQSRVPCEYDDNRSFMIMADIPKNYFAENFFDKALVQFIRNLACPWGTYGGFCDHALFQCCRDNPATFRRVLEHNGTALSASFFKTCLVKVRGVGMQCLTTFLIPLMQISSSTLNCHKTNQKTSVSAMDELNFSFSTQFCGR